MKRPLIIKAGNAEYILFRRTNLNDFLILIETEENKFAFKSHAILYSIMTKPIGKRT